MDSFIFISHPNVGLPKHFSSLDFHTKNMYPYYTYLITALHAAFPTDCIIFYYVVLTFYDD
jgi:hypothetical protein